MRRLVTLLAAALGAGLVAAPADAQQCRNVWQPDPFGDSGGSLTLICGDPAGGSGSQPAPKRPKGAQPAEPTRKQLRTLRFERSAEVSAGVRTEVADKLATGPQADQIRVLVESGDLLRQANRALRLRGWSTTDLGDMYAQAMIELWRVVHGREKRLPDRVERAVREDVRTQMALDRRTRRARDADQQAYAERLGSWTTVIAGSWNEYKKHDDTAGADQWRGNARELAGDPYLLGIDVGELRLTRKGVE